MSKSEIRKELLSSLRNMPKELSRSVCKSFLTLPQTDTASTVAVFMATPTEPDTSTIISCLQERGKRVLLPRVLGEELEFVELKKDTVLSPGAFGISEPSGEAFEGKIDLMAVPLVAFNENNYRLGHGKGYYDRYLASHSTFTVGLAFSMQKRDIPVDPWDIPLNMVVTDQYSK